MLNCSVQVEMPYCAHSNAKNESLNRVSSHLYILALDCEVDVGSVVGNYAAASFSSEIV